MPYFECLHCGTITTIEGTGPKCPTCGHGTGIIHQNEPPAAAARDESKKAKNADEPGEGRREPQRNLTRGNHT